MTPESNAPDAIANTNLLSDPEVHGAAADRLAADRLAADQLAADQTDDWVDEPVDTGSLDVALLDQIVVTTETLDGRRRKISAQIGVPYSLEQVWEVLTDYDHLADFVPNLARSRQIEHPDGGIRIEQIGSQSLLRFKFCARVVLDMFESFPRRLHFSMVEGDFKEFFGTWSLDPMAVEDCQGTCLDYTVTVLPSRLMPVGMIERRLSQGLKINLAAIQQRTDSLFGSSR